MTVAVKPSRASYLGDGVTVAFSAPFRFLSAAELAVSLVALDGTITLPSFTAAGGTTDAGGMVTLASPPAAGVKVRIARATARRQPADYVNSDTFPSDTAELGFDRQVMIAQEQDDALGEVVSRALIAPDGVPGLPFYPSDLVDGDLLEYRDGAIRRFDSAPFAGKFYAGGAGGRPVPASGTGSDANLRVDLAEPGGSGMIGHGTTDVGTVLGRFVFAEDYGYVGPLYDSAPAINAAIQAVKATGGDVILPNRVCRINNPILIGDGAAGAHSTYGAIRLKGFSGAPGIGAYNPLGGASILSYVAGPAIEVNGRLEGWGIEDLFIAFGTSDPTAIGLRVTEATRGYCPRMTIVNPPGGGVLLTTRNENNCESNVFPQLNIWLGTTYVNYGVKMTADGGGTIGNTSHNSFPDLVIIPGKSGQKCVWMQCCGTNYVENYACKSFDPTIDAMCFDYSVNDVWPVNNLFEKADWHGASITQIGAPNASVKAFGNRITGATQDNSARIPRLSGLTVERIKLATDTTFYVSNAGTDTGSVGLYAAGPWQTVQHAYDWIATQYDLNGYTATIKVAAGNYASLDASIPCVGGTIAIDGAGGSTAFNGASSPIRARSGTAIKVSNINLAPAVGPSLWADGGRIEVGAGVVFGAGTGYQDMLAEAGGLIRITGNYFISDGATSHMEARAGGRIVSDAVTVTFIGNATFSTAFATARTGGVISTPGVTYTLGIYAATAPRYLAATNGVIDTGGGGPNYYPGNSAGSAPTGGQYV